MAVFHFIRRFVLARLPTQKIRFFKKYEGERDETEKLQHQAWAILQYLVADRMIL